MVFFLFNLLGVREFTEFTYSLSLYLSLSLSLFLSLLFSIFFSLSLSPYYLYLSFIKLANLQLD